MTDNLKKIFELADLMSLVANQKKCLKEEFEQSLLFFNNGGCFKLDYTLISFLISIQSKNQKSVIVVDSNNTPVLIEDINSFLEDILLQYNEASTRYFNDFQQLKTKRTVESILDL